MSNRKRKAIDGFWVMAVIVGALTGGLARPLVVHVFWWSAADPFARCDEFWHLRFGRVGTDDWGLPGMMAGIATDDRI